MKPRAKASLREMAFVASREATRIRAMQACLVKQKVLAAPHEAKIRQAEIFEDISRLLLIIEPVQSEVKKILAPVARAMAAKEKYDQEAAEAAPLEIVTDNPEID